MSTSAWSDARSILANVPTSLEGLLHGLGPGWTEADEGPETFSAHEVVGHMADLEATDWVARLRIIMDDGPERPFDPVDRFAFRQWASSLAMEPLLEELKRRRSANLIVVDQMGLTDDDYLRRGRHPALGEVTLGQLLATWVVHDLTHVAQIARVMAKRYAKAVGPWAEYLSLLNERT